MHVFYTPDIEGPIYALNEQESKHCIQVLRLNVGDKVILVDGKGGFYIAEILDSTKKSVKLTVISVQKDYHKRPYHLHIAVAPTKNIDRYEWFLEKATEFGIDEITPIISERSERKIVKDERLQKVITAAVKQSMQAYHPVLNQARSFKEVIANAAKHKFIAHCEEDLKPFINEILPKKSDCIILIGPEGDFSSKEIQLALQHGFKPISLGTNRLRTETAALAACIEVNMLNR